MLREQLAAEQKSSAALVDQVDELKRKTEKTERELEEYKKRQQEEYNNFRELCTRFSSSAKTPRPQPSPPPSASTGPTLLRPNRLDRAARSGLSQSGDAAQTAAAGTVPCFSGRGIPPRNIPAAINAWLNSFKLNSSRKNGVHWGNVTKLYNSSTPKDRRRSRNQLKLHWHKITMKMAHFYDCWCQSEKKYSSVQSVKMQLMDKTWVKYDEEARAMYLEEAKHDFTLSHLWKAVWDQPKWKSYISSLYSKGTKLSESGDCMSSSEDANDVSEKEMDDKDSMSKGQTQCRRLPHEWGLGKGKIEASLTPAKSVERLLRTPHKDSMSAKKKWEGKSKMSSPSIELQQGIQSLVGPQNVLEKNNLVADTSTLYEFQHEKEKLMAGTLSFNELHHGNSVREDVPENGRHPQDCKGLEHAMTVRCAPEKETHPQSSKMEKAKRKRKGNISYPSSEVQEDIKCAVDLQRMLQKDREKMSEVQIQLSKEKLEMARLKLQEAKEKKETTLYEKYTELLMADTQRFNNFQKEEHQKAVKCMGVMLFGKDESISTDQSTKQSFLFPGASHAKISGPSEYNSILTSNC
ncbi:uncharacterized protein [Miscanthus floridulus]|uniref:uncharacterized protein n=1 Tax=Miscanthus floridulus TaxID=154761 RepID=UPI00345782A5